MKVDIEKRLEEVAVFQDEEVFHLELNREELSYIKIVVGCTPTTKSCAWYKDFFKKEIDPQVVYAMYRDLEKSL